MQEKEVYNPFSTKDYYLLNDNNVKYLLFNNNMIEICKNGYIPKSGLLFDIVLTEQICKNKTVLDLGCGYLGILSLIANSKEAKYIDSIDFDKECINWFQKIIKDNNLKNINCYQSNWFSEIKNKYDIILTNPPQMPMLEETLHDSGGNDGRKYILEILKDGINYLEKDGQLFILAFDFLGIENRTNDEESIMEIAQKYGYKDIKIILEVEKEIKKNSVTYNNLDYVKSIYPLYNFDNENKIKCNMQIISMRK